MPALSFFKPAAISAGNIIRFFIILASMDPSIPPS